jgi:hypothetical protein
VQKLEDAVPKCGRWYSRIVGPDDPLTEEDRCRACGEPHVIVVHEVLVRTHEDVERVRALNAAGGRS